MSLKILINTVFIGTQVCWAGTQYDDAVQVGTVANIALAGGVLAAAEDATIAAAALVAQAARKKGQNTDYVQGLMLAALAQSDGAVSLGYGDGSDGALVYDGTTTVLGMAPVATVYTLTRDILATSITVNGGATIKTVGFRLGASSTALNNGTIHNGGNAAALSVAGTAVADGSYGLNGEEGGAGGMNGNGADGVAQATSPNGPGAGGIGGAATNTGGASGTAVASAATVGSVKSIAAILAGASLGVSPVAFAGGGGGGGGAGVDASAVGGGGGAGGGCLLITAFRLINNGTIHCNGGAGAAGSGTTASGGGAGGGGGYLAILTKHGIAGSGAITANGGAGGLGTHTGANGAAGAAGTVVTGAM